MGPEPRAVFGSCLGFDAARGREGFAAHIARGQVETTMPFNDYRIDPPNLPTLSVGLLAALALGLPLLSGAAAWLLGGGWMLAVAAGLLELVAGLWAAYRLVVSRGARPLPAGAGGVL